MTPAVLVIGGPTAAGKTAAAIAVAEAYGAEVLSADAMQVYLGMDVGTGKATAEERGRVVHHGIDVVEPVEDFDVADFLTLAEPLLADGRRLIVAGGTSLYLRGLQRGVVSTPDPDPELRASLLAEDDERPGALHERLQALDPVLAGRLHPHDRVRVVRGVEVVMQSGQRLSDLQAAHAAAPDRVRVEATWLDHPDLDTRIDARVLQMIERGYVAETDGLLTAGVPRTAKPMLSLGYRHLADHLVDGLPLDEAIRRTQRDTRRFARKQRTWHGTLGYPVGRDPLEAAAVLWGAP